MDLFVLSFQCGRIICAQPIWNPQSMDCYIQQSSKTENYWFVRLFTDEWKKAFHEWFTCFIILHILHTSNRFAILPFSNVFPQVPQHWTPLRPDQSSWHKTCRKIYYRSIWKIWDYSRKSNDLTQNHSNRPQTARNDCFIQINDEVRSSLLKPI